jgi:hypothetical protein
MKCAFFFQFVLAGDVDKGKVHYCERFLELLIDLEALLPTRRFFNTVLDDCHLVVRCKIASLTQRPEGHLFKQVRWKLIVFYFVLFLFEIYPPKISRFVYFHF